MQTSQGFPPSTIKMEIINYKLNTELNNNKNSPGRAGVIYIWVRQRPFQYIHMYQY